MTIFKIKRTFFLFFVVLSCTILSCKRYSNNETEQELIPEKNSISKLEVQTILNSKVNLVNYSEPNKYSFFIPDYYEAATNEYKNGDIDLQYGKLNSKTKAIIYVVDIKSTLSKDGDYADEEVSIVPEDNSNLLTISDIKQDFKNIEQEKETPIFYEDSNSIIYGEDLEVIYFEYDFSLKSYIIYQGNVSHFGQLAQKDKFNLAMHLLKNGKNLLKKNLLNNPFNSWEEYVQNLPDLEINSIKQPFVSLNKEIKVFLNINEKVDIQNSYTQLYRASSEMQLTYLSFLGAIKFNKVADFNLSDKVHDDFESKFINYEADNKYSIQQIENVDIIKIVDPDYENNVEEKLICNIKYQDKNFYIISKNSNDLSRNLFIKMFNYFSKNLTLDVPSKK